MLEFSFQLTPAIQKLLSSKNGRTSGIGTLMMTHLTSMTKTAFPSILAIVRGPTITVPDDGILWSFERYLSCHDGSIIKEALKEYEDQVKSLSNEMKS